MTVKPLLLALLPLLTYAGCVTTPTRPPDPPGPALASAAPDAGTVVLHVTGLGCPLCATNVKKGLTRLEGVRDARVDLGAGRVLLGTDPARTPTDGQFADTVKQCGFTLVRVERPE